jgi:hypothetical protein
MKAAYQIKETRFLYLKKNESSLPNLKKRVFEY